MTTQVTPLEFDNHSSEKRIAFIRADWHADVVDNAEQGFLNELKALSVDPGAVDVYTVPGAYEIPLLAKKLAQTGRYSGVIAAALVVDGGIYRHDFVAEAVVSGLMRVQLDTDVPVFSVVLTPHNYQETEALTGFYRDHFVPKGAEAARAFVGTVKNFAAVGA